MNDVKMYVNMLLESEKKSLSVDDPTGLCAASHRGAIKACEAIQEFFKRKELPRDKPLKTLNLYAGSGAGKSTTAAGVYSLLKLHGCPVELVTEFAKDLTWEERHKTLKNQTYIFAKQYHRLFRLDKGVDLAITDSPLPLSIHYANIDVVGPFVNVVMDAFNEFDNINFFVKRTKPYWRCGRTQTEEEAKIVDQNLLKLLDYLDIDYQETTGDINGINEITSYILETVYDKELKFKLQDIVSTEAMVENIISTVGNFLNQDHMTQLRDGVEFDKSFSQYFLGEKGR